MSALSDIASGLAAAVCSFTIVSAAGCGTDAKGIDDCRNIEEARCEAAKNCGIPGLTDVDGCRRFYRDQCLHGLPVASPGSPAVAGCVAVIRAAGSCATSPDTELTSCSPALSEDPLTKACEVVVYPELTHECAFLAPSAATGGAAGSAGMAGSAGTAGSSGSGGDAGNGGTGGAGTAGAAGAAG